MRELSAAGVRVVVMTAPIIPGVNDMEMPALLQAAAAAGATGAGYVLLRLPWQNKGIFEDWLAREFPQRAEKVEGLVRGTRGGRLYSAAWGSRMRGEGEIAAQIGRTFEVFARRYGLNAAVSPLSSRGFVRPAAPSEHGQLGLFDGPARSA
jgi:DNA repair photolyase